MLNNITKLKFKPEILLRYTDIKVRELCKSCKRYGYKTSCPPHIESVDYYKKLLPSFKYGILIFKKFKIKDITKWEQLGENSSLEIGKELIKIRTSLFNKVKFGIVFGSGSCKVCKECSFPCRFPNKAIIPLEGTGINVIKLFQKIAKIKLKYPVEKYGYFYRIGIILYD